MSTTLDGDRPNLVFGLGPSIYSDKSWHTHSIRSAVTGEAATQAAEIVLDTSVRTAVALSFLSTMGPGGHALGVTNAPETMQN